MAEDTAVLPARVRRGYGLGARGGDGPLQVPDRMAEVNALLDAVPPTLREALLAAVLDRLTR